MSLIDKYSKEAHVFPRPFERDPGEKFHLLNGERVNDVLDLARLEAGQWRRMNKELHASGDPTMLESLFGGLMATPLASAASAAVNPAVATATNLWTPFVYTPVPANAVMVPETFRLAVTGIFTTTATASPTLVLTPGITTNIVPAGAFIMGASRAIPLTASVTTGYWYLLGDMTVRTAGDGSTAGSIYGMFTFAATAAAGPNTAAVDELFGHTVATFDPKVANGIAMAMTSNPAGATTSMTVQQIHFMSWN